MMSFGRVDEQDAGNHEFAEEENILQDKDDDGFFSFNQIQVSARFRHEVEEEEEEKKNEAEEIIRSLISPE